MRCINCKKHPEIGRKEVVFINLETGKREITAVRYYNQCKCCRDKMYKKIAKKNRKASHKKRYA